MHLVCRILFTCVRVPRIRQSWNTTWHNQFFRQLDEKDRHRQRITKLPSALYKRKGGVDHSGKDDKGLGRWCYMKFCVSEVIKTRVVCGYNPCYNNKKELNKSYQQLRRFFITKQKNRTCPRKCFWEYLIPQLKQWREEGDQLIVCLETKQKHIQQEYRKGTYRQGRASNVRSGGGIYMSKSWS